MTYVILDLLCRTFDNIGAMFYETYHIWDLCYIGPMICTSYMGPIEMLNRFYDK